MSSRLSTGGKLIDRSLSKEFIFNGRRMKGFEGDTLASALLANDQVMVGRSFKYHRPRGIVASGSEEPNALMEIGSGAKLEPNQRATTTKLFDGMRVKSQNHWPTLEFDIGAINSAFSKFFPAIRHLFIQDLPGNICLNRLSEKRLGLEMRQKKKIVILTSIFMHM